MARLFLATEAALGRRVVIKVLAPELAESVSADRFRREMELAASLQHPHITPVLTSGRAEGLLFYTMPYVEGESLRALLDRRGELPIPEVVRLLSEIARALSYAHRRGIIHRDIKPGNILIADGEAQVADFGLAKALSNTAEQERLTSSGLAVGTPLYMAPEQASASADPDCRSDLYSLGVVAYEMLTGSPPFSERTARAIMAAHVLEPPPPVAMRRLATPPALADVVMRLLQKSPADRPQSADEVLQALESSSTPARPTTSTRQYAPAIRWSGWAALALIATLGVARSITRHGESAPPPMDSSVIAVVPFRVAGADSSLHYLREGMLDLLANRLSGTEVVRTVDPRTMLRAWQRAGADPDGDLDRPRALDLTRQLGAGSLLEGEVVGTPSGLVLTATLTDAAGAVKARASVEGPSDSLASLVDRLAAHLLVYGANEAQERLTTLTTASLPALRAYLDGMAANRRGDYASSVELFDRALELDSTFALAGVRRAMVGGWIGDLGTGRDIAWRYRTRLPKRDLLQLYTITGQNYPIASAREDINNAEAWVSAAPDDPEAWSRLGDHLFHYGALAGVSDAPARSLRVYARAARLDSTYAPTFEHLHELHYTLGDTAAARRALARLLHGKPKDADPESRWFARACLGDTVMGVESLTSDSLASALSAAIGISLEYACGLADAESLLSYARAGIATDSERRNFQTLWWTFYVSRGKPRQALIWSPDPSDPVFRAGIILDALYADADMEQAARLAAKLPRIYPRPTVETNWESIVEGYAGAQYQLASGRAGAAQEAVRAWKRVWAPGDTSQALRLALHLGLLLDAQLAALQHRSDALARLTELDSVLVTGPTYGEWLPTGSTFGGFEPVANLLAARLWHERGEPGRALATIRRRTVGLRQRSLFASQIRDEARYAASVGDREGTVRAYRHYLRLRADPEPALRAKVQEVWAEFETLRSDSGDR
jgi:hypothetical protein